jgi:hypothetical protein
MYILYAARQSVISLALGDSWNFKVATANEQLRSAASVLRAKAVSLIDY